MDQEFCLFQQISDSVAFEIYKNELVMRYILETNLIFAWTIWFIIYKVILGCSISLYQAFGGNYGH